MTQNLGGFFTNNTDPDESPEINIVCVLVFNIFHDFYSMNNSLSMLIAWFGFDAVWRRFQQVFRHITVNSSPTHGITGYHTPVLNTPDYPSYMLLFHIILLAH